MIKILASYNGRQQMIFSLQKIVHNEDTTDFARIICFLLLILTFHCV